MARAKDDIFIYPKTAAIHHGLKEQITEFVSEAKNFSKRYKLINHLIRESTKLEALSSRIEKFDVQIEDLEMKIQADQEADKPVNKLVRKWDKNRSSRDALLTKLKLMSVEFSKAIENFLEVGPDIGIRDFLEEEKNQMLLMKGAEEYQHFSKQRNYASAVFVLHSETGPNFTIGLNIEGHRVTSFSQTRHLSPQLHRLIPFIGPIGLSAVNTKLYCHSEQDIMHRFFSNAEMLRGAIMEVSQGNVEQYRLTFNLFTQREPCGVCSRCVKNFCEAFEQFTGIATDAYITYDISYGKSDLVAAKVNALRAEGLDVTLGRIIHNYDQMLEHQREAIRFRVVELGLSFYHSDDFYGMEGEGKASGSSTYGQEDTIEDAAIVNDQERVKSFISGEQELSKSTICIDDFNIDKLSKVLNEFISSKKGEERFDSEISRLMEQNVSVICQPISELDLLSQSLSEGNLASSGYNPKSLHRTPQKKSHTPRIKPTPGSRKRVKSPSCDELELATECGLSGDGAGSEDNIASGSQRSFAERIEEVRKKNNSREPHK